MAANGAGEWPEAVRMSLAAHLVRGAAFALGGLVAGVMGASLTAGLGEWAWGLGQGEALAFAVGSFALLGAVGGVLTRKALLAIAGAVVFAMWATLLLATWFWKPTGFLVTRWVLVPLSLPLALLLVQFEDPMHRPRWWAGLVYLAAPVLAAFVGVTLAKGGQWSLAELGRQWRFLAPAYGLSGAVLWGLVGCVADLPRGGRVLPRWPSSGGRMDFGAWWTGHPLPPPGQGGGSGPFPGPPAGRK